MGQGVRRNYIVVGIVVACVLLIAADRIWSLPLLRALTAQLWLWVLVLAAAAALLGVFNVLVVHLRRVVEGTRSWANSLILVATALAVFVMGLLGEGGSRSLFAEWVYLHILSPGLATLFAMLAFFTLAAAYRYLRISPTTLDGAAGNGGDSGGETAPSAQATTERSPASHSSAIEGGGWMLAGALLFLILQMPMLNAVLPVGMSSFAGWVLDVPAMAVFRGVLLGGSIALVLTGVRLAFVGK